MNAPLMTATRRLREIARGNLEALPPRESGNVHRFDPRAEERDARVLRLLSEFVEEPDRVRLDRLLEAYKAWKKSGQDRRGLALEPGLAALESYGRRKIAEREAWERHYAERRASQPHARAGR